MWKTLAVFCQLNNPKLPSIQSPKYSIKNRWRRLGKNSVPPRHLRQFAAMIASDSPPRFTILHGTYTIQKYTSSSAHQTSFMKREICSLAQRPPSRRHMLRRGRENSDNEHHQGQNEGLETQILK